MVFTLSLLVTLVSSLAVFAYGESVSESSLEFAKLLRFKIDFTGMSENMAFNLVTHCSKNYTDKFINIHAA